MKVLIVDDSELMRINLCNIIEKAGHEVVGEAEEGIEAFEKYQELKPDLVTMDITMPKHSGLDGLELIHQFDAEAKVLMVSAMGHRTAIIKAKKLGAIDFITKPFVNEEVIQKIKKIESNL